ncbi:MAG TPA: MFS transporter [Candidatus Thermoplasmatota archaeon]|nr:MFS transporter [Candidatus Thermoplasmatota archaeon]
MLLRRALRHKDLRLFLAGQTVSQLGDMVFFVALSWAALEATEGAFGLGVVFAAYTGAQVLFLLLGGVLVDRFPRRSVHVASDAVQGTLGLLLAVAALAGALHLPVLVVFGALFGAASAVALPAVSSLLPETVPKEDLPAAVSLYQGVRTAALLGGPALGGLLYALAGSAAAFAFDAATYAVSILLVRGLRAGRRAPVAEPTPVLAGAREGFRYVRQRPWIWIAILLFALVNLAETGPRNVALPVLLEESGEGAEAFGIVHSAGAVGAIAASAALGMLAPARRGLLAYASVVLAGASVAATAFAHGTLALAAASLARGAAFAAFVLLWETALGSEVEPSMRGRVNSLDLLGSWLFLPASALATALTVGEFGARWAFLAGGAAIVALGLLGLLLPKARRFGGDARGAETSAPA